MYIQVYAMSDCMGVEILLTLSREALPVAYFEVLLIYDVYI